MYWETIGWLSIGTTPDPLAHPHPPKWERTTPQEIAMQIAANPLQIDTRTQWRGHGKP